MLITVFGGKTGDIKILCDSRASGSGKKTGFCADTGFFHTGRHIEISVLQALVDTGHNLFPEVFVEVTGIFRNFFVVVIAGPYCTGVVRCVAYEPQVIVVLCSTCFSGYRHIVQLAGGTGTFFYNVFHGACKKISGTIFDHRSGNGGVLDQNISVMIKDLCIIDRFDIVPAISNGCICSTKFHVLDTFGDTAKSSSQVGVTPDISVGIFICLSSVSQCGETEIIQIFKAESRGNLLQAFNSYNVDGILDRFADGGLAAVAS